MGGYVRVSSSPITTSVNGFEHNGKGTLARRLDH
jgi:hypothetical protein